MNGRTNLKARLAVAMFLPSLVCFTAQADNCLKTLYVDGVKIDEATVSQGLQWAYDRITIGAQGNRWWLYNEYVGKIDEFAIYTGVLSDSRIAAHYAAKDSNTAYFDAVQYDNPLLWLRFEDTSTDHNDVALNSGSIGIDGQYVATGVEVVTQETGINAGSNCIVLPDAEVNEPGTCVDVWDGNGDFGEDLDGDVTIELWVNFTNIDSMPENGYPRFFQHNDNWNNENSYGLMVNNEPNQIGIIGGGCTDFMELPYDINDANWHHIVVTYDSTYVPIITKRYPMEVLADNPVLYLRFEQEPLVDSSGNNYWVDANDEVIIEQTQGSIGKAAYLNGGWVAAANQTFEPCLPTDYNHAYAFAPNDITFEFWLYYPDENAVSDFVCFFNQCDDDDPNYYSPGADRAGTKCRMLFGDNRPGGGGLAYTAEGAWSEDANNWHHIVAIWNTEQEPNGTPISTNVKWYTDNVKYKDSTYPYPAVADGIIGPEMDHILFGNRGSRDAPGYIPYRQYIDEIAVYPYVLSEERIRAHYEAGGPVRYIYVDGSATGADDGTSWEDAYNYLQDALADSNLTGPAEIWVAQGTYQPDDVNTVSFIPEDLVTGLDSPHDIALDITSGKMYWMSEMGQIIQRSNLDGSGVEDLVTGLDSPRGIALDTSAGKMYWTENQKIQRANLNGTGIEDLVTGLDSPQGIELDIAGGKMYWTADMGQIIQRANLDGSGVEDLVTGLDSPQGIALDTSSGKMYWMDGGMNQKIQRANLDGTGIEDLVTGLELDNPKGIALDIAGGKIYWTADMGQKIQRANLDGSGVEDLITAGLDYPQGIALDTSAGKMYWTDAGTNKIQRANYTLTGDRTATFQLINGVALYGGFPSGGGTWDDRDPSLYETILSGDLDGNDIDVDDPCDLLNEPTRAENSYHVVTGSGTDANAVLDGFTITAGNADGPIPNNQGGGMYNDFGNPTVTNCTFVGNSAFTSGGGMYNHESSPILTNCKFSENWAQSAGGMRNVVSSPTVTNCTFSGNSADYAGGMHNSGNSSPTVTNCTFNNNSAATSSAGGMSNINSSNPIVTNCTFSGNSADVDGGGMSNTNSSNPIVTNCTFSGNSANIDGGGIRNNSDSNPMVTNCTFSGNDAGLSAGGMQNDNYSYPTLTNCILWGNTDLGGMDESAQIHNYDESSPIVNYCCVQGWTGGLGGTGNIGDDPLFMDANGPDCIIGTEDDNLRLSFGSPCIDAGDNNSVPADITDLDNDANVTEPIPFDLDGEARFEDDLVQADTGNGTAPIVDMGAYEKWFRIVDLNLKAAVEAELGLTDPNAIDMLALTELNADNNGIIDLTGLEYATNLSELYLNDNQISDIFALTRLTNLTVLDLTGNPLDKETRGAYLSLILANNPGINLSYDPIYVDATAAGNNDGTSWENAFNYLQDALADPNLVGPAEIWVAQGTYKPDQGGGETPGDRTATFQLINGVAIYGGFPSGGGVWSSRSPSIYETVLSGDIGTPDVNTDNSYHVVTGSGTEPNAVLDGFTITAGQANEAEGEFSGGGMHNNFGSPTVVNCTFSGNNAYAGGGMYSHYNSPTVINCYFSGNWAYQQGGGGMYNTHSSPTLTNCIFSGNWAYENGGGGIKNSNSNPTLINCSFSSNWAELDGGGMYNDISSPGITNCTFSGNSAYGYGGGMGNSNCGPTITNCTFTGNDAGSEGGGVYNQDSNPNITNCILWENIDGGGMDESAQIHNSGSGTAVTNYCCVQGWTGGLGGTGNIGDDPLFVDANGTDNIFGTEDDNLQLSFGSPCIDAGDNTAVLGGIVTDLGGNPRFRDDPATSDTGNGTPPIVDMGAYEYQSNIICVDANANGLNDGESWTDAYNYLQDALADPNLVGSAEIWVAEGTYKPDQGGGETPGDRTATFQLQNGVALYGGFPSGGGTWEDRDPTLYQTILSGDISVPDVNTDNSYHVVTGSGTDANAVLNGFTITAGHADMIEEGFGGGMYNNGSPTGPTVTNCTFTGNFAHEGGGGMYNNVSSPTVTNCTFSGNFANNYGGGMYNYDSGNPTVTNCTFTGNSTTYQGGGMTNNSSHPTLTNCTFSGNSADYGGGVYNLYTENYPILTNCTFSGNSADYGGGIYNYESDPEITNCVFRENRVEYDGGEMYNDNGSGPSLTNCTLVGNIYNHGSYPSLINCIIWGEMFNDDSTATVNYCDVQGGWSGTGNIDDDPLIWDTKGHLLSNSLCRNAGDPNGDYSGQTDMDGQPRVLEGRVDIGADEMLPAIQNIDTNEVYGTIQEAIDDANDGETIVVQPGTYTGSGNDRIYFPGKAITLRSAEPNDPNVVAATIIKGDGYNTIVRFQSIGDANSVLNGFTITNAGGEAGGAIYCYQNSPTIKNCILRNNAAYWGGGIYCQDANPIIHGGTIRDNSPDGIYLDANSTVLILGTVHIISNDIVGQGSVQFGPGGSLDLDDAHVFTGMSGAGTMQVALGAKATIDGDSVINLGDPCNPSIRGTIDCKGLLVVKDNSRITNAKINITKATFEDRARISNSEIHVDSKAPYGTSLFADPNTSFVDVNIYADGDRYMDMDPSVFDGNFVNVGIFVTITEGVGQPCGSLLECRGEPNLADVNSCDPNNGFFCLANPGTIPDCNISTWTLERLELIAGAKLNLTNRFPFQPPYDPGTDYDVVYVKELILRQGSVLNTSFNHIYYDDLIIEPNAVIKNEPLLGFSMINIALDDQTEFIVRVTHNNYTDHNDPNYSRTHVERIEGLAPDANGMMIMRNLEDLDPNSGTYLQTKEARAKGLFSKSSENEIFIRFEYLFGSVDPNTELVIYLSDIPELGDLNEPNDYYEVARLLPPLTGQAGSVGSGKFGIFKEYVPTGGLDFIRGTRVEFRLLGGSGVYMYINNWDPQVLCDGICLDLNWSTTVDEEDFLIVLGNCGSSTQLPTLACLEGPFGEDGTVDSRDICGWDWALNSEDRLNCCGPLPLTGSGGGGGGSSVYTYLGGGGLDDLLILGKRGTASAPGKLEDCLYVFDGSGQYSDKLTPVPNRGNEKLVGDFDGNVYRLNSELGILNLDGSEVVVGPAQFSGVPEPRYGTTADVYVCIQGTGNDSYGRPISDVAFDPYFSDNDIVYVVPVVVEPEGQEAYTAAAKLQLSVPSYSVVKLYDDPDAANPGDNRQLDELREVEIDTDGYLYVLNAYSDNESDILWKYDASSGEMMERLVLSDVPSPGAVYMSTAQDMLYLASSLSPADSDSSTVYGFSTAGALKLTRQITVNKMGHVTGITEDPTTGTLWVAGFSMDPPAYPNPIAPPFYEPNLAGVPIGSDNVDAISALNADPNDDLALPLSIVWTGAISLQEECGGADLDFSGEVNFEDFRIFAQHWYETGCVVPDWCGGADLNPYIKDRGQIDLADLAIFSQNWLKSGCLD